MDCIIIEADDTFRRCRFKRDSASCTSFTRV